jgi:salicylate hydroxylase
MKKKIAIIGSGIAGLTLANLLRMSLNSEFVVYEKEDNLNLSEGFGIQLSVNSVSVLNKLGFNNLNKSEIYHPKKLDFYTKEYNKICDLDLTIFNSIEEKYTTLKRSTLIKFLKEKLLSNSILFRKKINRVKQIDKKIEIYFTDGTSEKVDYLVISDGVFSNTKSIVENRIFKPIYNGGTAIRVEVKKQDVFNFNNNNISIVMSSGAHLVLYPINKAQDFNLISIIRNKLDNKQETIKALENSIFKENKNLSTLFKEDLKTWPIYISGPPIKSIYKNVFYIGDAFYTFPPSFAQGAAQAIESAYEIFNLIRNEVSDMQNIYFKNRLERIKLVNNRSKFNYFIFHISNTILKIFRNKILKILIKNKKFINNYLGKVYK